MNQNVNSLGPNKIKHPRQAAIEQKLAETYLQSLDDHFEHLGAKFGRLFESKFGPVDDHHKSMYLSFGHLIIVLIKSNSNRQTNMRYNPNSFIPVEK